MFHRDIHSLADLVESGLIKDNEKQNLEQLVKLYPVSLTSTVVNLLNPSDPNDPIARQFLPRPEELFKHKIEIQDPIGDDLKTPIKGIVHRHPDRVLLKIIAICPVYCRFCFRREMIGPQKGENLTKEDLEKAFVYIKKNPQIWEIILTGGDPFMLSERRIGELVEKIETIPHIKIIRWHTRVPFVSPERITPLFINNLKKSNKTVIIGLHVNHPKEFSETARSAITNLRESGIMLVSQSVLLRGVNDSVDTLEELMRTCLEAGIQPYYLHHPDLTHGTQHFRVPISRGLDIMKELHRRLSKLACPDYVLDLPGAFGKISLLSSQVHPYDEFYLIKDVDGRVHTYREAL